MNDVVRALEDRLGAGRVSVHEPMARYTTFRVGGPADWFVEPRGRSELLTTIVVAHELNLPLTVLGGGSNVLIADAGIRGIVMRPRGGDVAALGPYEIRADAAVTINGLVRWTLSRGVAGVEAWAGTPGTVAGAVFGNAHFSGRNIGELVTIVEVSDRVGKVQMVPVREMAFGYDRSRLQKSGEIVVSVGFAVSQGEPAALRATARQSLAFRKRTQPLESPSAGCVFQNPQPGTDRVPEGIPWSAGALVDRAGLKGAIEGGARVAASHANFIINDGSASAADIRRLINRCRDEVKAAFGVELREEIVYLGDFDR